ncbi:ABC transporter [Streptomyces rishiriensis]|uniref:Fluoroquinolone transport system permease protein n=1 Tax=Streptomyces rishiriensis TaxID=68264 RepID=A0ABU0NRZ8_STRRH|nr:ABC transporter [Streptomyces rishiriensis]MDQ0581911.1 fluoroquinolone transport system permease protein [Streptomyces rishiriensis]
MHGVARAESTVVPPGLLRSLVPPVWRGLPWRALTTVGGLGLLLAGATRLPEHAPDAELGRLVLRLIALTGALGLAFVLDDPARDTTATTPVGRPRRTVLRLAFVAPLLALWWAAVLLLTPAPARPALGPATLEAAGMAGAALALATIAVRFTRTAEVGRGAAIRLGAAAAVAVLVPNRWGLLGTSQDPYWAATQVRWALLLGVTVTLSVLWTPEPLRGGRPRRHGSGRLGPSGGGPSG